MLCQECRRRPATVRMTTIVDGQRSDVHLCEECARTRGELEFGGEAKISLGDMLAALLHQHGVVQPPGAGEGQEGAAKCGTCGFSYEMFVKTGKLGCGACFAAFEPQMRQVLRHVHGSTRHVGRMPRRTGGQLRREREMRGLRQELSQCVQREQFERAAEIRDRIRQLEATGAEEPEQTDVQSGEARA
jgi:protein arginine kinase activator